MIWYTIYTYVDRTTGEIINKDEVLKNYVIYKKTKKREYEYKYINRKRTTIGIQRITAECERNGKQRKLFNTE